MPITASHPSFIRFLTPVRSRPWSYERGPDRRSIALGPKLSSRKISILLEPPSETPVSDRAVTPIERPKVVTRLHRSAIAVPIWHLRNDGLHRLNHSGVLEFDTLPL